MEYAYACVSDIEQRGFKGYHFMVEIMLIVLFINTETVLD